MRKLLLILICLFISFEVKSESDDLTGLELLCSTKKKGDKNKSYEITGIEFTSDKELYLYDLYFYTYHTVIKKPKISKYLGEYNTNLSYVWIYLIEFHDNQYEINRHTLEYKEKHLTKQIGDTASCKIVKNLPKIFEELQQKEFERIKKLKSKQKI